MSYYVGIDLGTTNSAVSTFDGQNVRIWKSPEQTDVTPSAIYIDRRGNRYYGMKAYNQAPYNPANSATLFKRFMGTTQKFPFAAAKLELSAEECSAEILKVLYGYIPEEIRNSADTCTVITVPAAFNQMKKDATLQAAQLAGIGKVALMQEPVAAIMSVMRTTKQEGIFLVYDIGGGTFDLSIAESIGGKVNLLSHSGVEMCGGRDIDKSIFNSVVVPWLKENFDLPNDFLVNPKYRTFRNITYWSIEQAKIELSSVESCTIALSEDEARTTDESGNEIYLDINICRTQLDKLMEDLVAQTIDVTREIMKKSGLTSNDIERIVFVGGPSNYKPLRDKVAYELSLPQCIDVNPMTAVSEGASIFAESIDWSTEMHNRKASNEILRTNIDLNLKYTARTPATQARVMCVLGSELSGYTIQFTSLDTGWSSGAAELVQNKMFMLPLHMNGSNRFSVKVFDPQGNRREIGLSEIEIVKTLASVGAIPASHSIFIEALGRLGGQAETDFLVKQGDYLPKKGTRLFKAGQTVRSGTDDTLNFKLWEGDIESPISDNRFIGVMKISGRDLEIGVIPTGADIECEYEMSDSGTINLQVSIPCIGASFDNHNFYSRQEGETNLADVDGLAEEGRSIVERIDEMSEKVNDPQLAKARKMATLAANIDAQNNCDPEDVQKASNDLLEAKKLVYKTKQENIKDIRQLDLERHVQFYEEVTKQYFSPADAEAFENLIRTARNAIERNDSNFDFILQKMIEMNAITLLRQDWVIIDWYRTAVASPADYVDPIKFRELKRVGDQALASGDIDTLRNVFFQLKEIQIRSSTEDEMFDIANIVKG